MFKSKTLEYLCEHTGDAGGLVYAKDLLKICLNPKYSECVGLAHNQIGGKKRVFVAKVGKNKTWKTFINAEIVSYNGKKFIHNESCMSFPKRSSDVERYQSVTIRHLVPFIGEVEETFTGFNACIIQHEIDHLNGIHILNKEISND